MAAHGDTGVLELVETVPVDDDSVTYVVELTYESDGDPVPGKDVTVVVDGGAPQPMTSDGDGLYSATVDFPAPGDHTVHFAVDEPAAELDVDQEITTTTTTAAAQATTTTTDAPVLATDHDDANGTWLLILMAVIVVAMVTLAVAFVRGRRPPKP